MTTTDSTIPSSPPSDAAAAAPLTLPLPEVGTALPAQEVTSRLDLAARRGRLPGYSTGGGGGALFEMRDFGAPFEGVLRARLDGGTLRFSTSLQPRMPVVMAVILLLSIWPGVWLTESAMASIFPSSPVMWKWTYWWYLPLAIVSSPWAMWSAIKKSRESVHAGAHGLIAKVAAELKGTPAAARAGVV